MNEGGDVNDGELGDAGCSGDARCCVLCGGVFVRIVVLVRVLGGCGGKGLSEMVVERMLCTGTFIRNSPGGLLSSSCWAVINLDLDRVVRWCAGGCDSLSVDAVGNTIR